ncbi:hypothetical protein Z045_05700 [Rhodococcus pyridinivorans KG-16]|uniref:DUF1320 domain-containing protein n=1 Tax=Rhodococcus pyridinivorans KG-16 TaxID=1441730 RepID=A0A0V9UNT0_9NOCA|nr:phage protein Gp36 family protein [Rhodococcus pyridinivorans]KSZ59665.1 hypothetical protein Z045_05700 [Rhodococcus pyridinivorans KG-16]
MSTTLNVESFSEINIRERSTLAEGAEAGSTVLTLSSTEGYVVGDILYLGNLSREGCEKTVIASVDDATTVTLTNPTTLPHARFEPVTSVLGDLIRIYRAVNVDGGVPSTEMFAVLATRSIDPDQLSTYFTDSQGSSNYWYRFTYFNATTMDETSLNDSIPVRGDDFGHYASLTEIRREAGFENATNLSDVVVDQKRRAAESEVNTALSSAYTTPFDPVPEIIRTLTIQLAAGYLLQYAYGERSAAASVKLKDARTQMEALQNRDQTITDDTGNSIAGDGISYWPGENEPRAFTMDQRF